MKYVFVKEFNPAYDRFLMAYFKEHGLGLDENTTLKELESRVSHFDQGKMSAEELLLTVYMWNWGPHPECRPSLYWLLNKTMGGNGHPDPEKLRQLESKLSPEELRKMVVTPGGTTAAGLAVMEKEGTTEGLIAAVEAATKRAQEMAEEHL